MNINKYQYMNLKNKSGDCFRNERMIQGNDWWNESCKSINL